MSLCETCNIKNTCPKYIQCDGPSWYRAEVLSISEFREYQAATLDDAVELAEAEWGADDIGRVTEKR